MKIILLTLFIAACAKLPPQPKTRYELLDQLWRNHATRSDVINELGVPSVQEERGLGYQSIQSAHFFDQDGKIQEQFLMVHPEKLGELKTLLKCSWAIEEKQLTISHTVRTVESGTCANKDISYEFLVKSGMYEVRWKKGTR